ncbi:hypothetical protein AOQ84DRAFT_363416 [Glonium stellatum]|uniref:Uncharacterized protein n=1 Tax=Glonium stellatum TaxID=574774 RepID=A0A8E2F2K7_9PEZI|nr:hypothetical protein AOQ84DRAFT_363416 [Glonium stellatum]
MPNFLELPRELRDMIYMAVLTSEVPRPSLSDNRLRPENIHQIGYHVADAQPGEFGNAYTLDESPSTCASLLCSSRQVNKELGEAINRAKSRGQMPLKMDCLVLDERIIYVTWISFPLVRTHIERPWFKPPKLSTNFHQLQVDVRLTGTRKRKWTDPFITSKPPGRIAWGVCAALKRILDNGPEFSARQRASRTYMIDELILNVITPSGVPPEGFLPEDYQAHDLRDGLVHPKSVARELNEVWNYIWAPGFDPLRSHYWPLIERIGIVRVCIDSETWRTRELQLELKRGQDERRRIALRGR